MAIVGCPECGQECRPTAGFCPFCGQSTDWNRKLEVGTNKSISPKYLLQILIAVLSLIFLVIFFKTLADNKARNESESSLPDYAGKNDESDAKKALAEAVNKMVAAANSVGNRSTSTKRGPRQPQKRRCQRWYDRKRSVG